MVLCFVALIIFAILGIFSAKYRKLAAESFDCVVRTVTLRPCESRLDERLQATILGKLLPISPAAARMLNRHFKAISLAFTILFFASFIYTGVSVYNYWAYGNCNGPDSTGFCAFDAVLGKTPGDIKYVAPGVGPVLGNGSLSLVQFGCFTCPYTRSAQSALKEFLAAHPEVKMEFRAFPIPKHANSTLAAQAAFCADEQGAFWPYYDALFSNFNQDSREDLLANAANLSLDTSTFAACLDSNRTLSRVQTDVEAGKAAGLYGTPTFYLNETVMVGPQGVKQFEDALAGRYVAGSAGGSCPPPEGIPAE